MINTAAKPHVYQQINITNTIDLRSLERIYFRNPQYIHKYTTEFLLDARIRLDTPLHRAALRIINECRNLKFFKLVLLTPKNCFIAMD